MTAPQRSGDHTAASRGVVLLVVAVVVGAFLLARGSSGSILGDRSSGNGGNTTTTLPPQSTSTTAATPSTTKSAAQLKVAIYNATGGKISSAAGNSQSALANAGYASANLSIADAPDTRSTSTVYYQSSANRADAAVVAAKLQLPNNSVQAVGSTSLPTSAQGADVVVFIGLDAQNDPVVTGSSGTGGSTTVPGASSSSTPDGATSSTG